MIIQASHEDLALIENASAEVDVVINAATSDDLELTKAINKGLAKAKSVHGRKGVLVHISGTQLIESKPTGKLEDVPKYDDLDVEQIKSIPDSALHRLIDLEYVQQIVSDSQLTFDVGRQEFFSTSLHGKTSGNREERS